MENYKKHLLFGLIFVSIVILLISSITLTMRVGSLEKRADYLEADVNDLSKKVYENSIRIDEITEEQWITPND